MQFLHHGYLLLPQNRPPVLERLNAYFKIYQGASPVDRTGTIHFPTRMKSVFQLPMLRSFQSSYEDVCDQRAVFLLRLASHLGVEIYVFWSGGVDSTCALISLLKHCHEYDRIIVLLTENSILEYPLFYSRHIRGKLPYRSATLLGDLFTMRALIVNGEHNDQLFGSDIIADAIALFGIEAVTGRLQREFLTSLFEVKLEGDRDTALFLSGLFGRLVETAPLPLKTNFDLLWWINFALKWQTVYMRSLIFSKGKLSPQHIATYYHPFFNTTEFQLWSMNNPDKRITNHWRTYKWPAKKLIYDFTKDADYRDNKIKRRSLQSLVAGNPYHKFLDETFVFREQMDWYQPQNDF